MAENKKDKLCLDGLSRAALTALKRDKEAEARQIKAKLTVARRRCAKEAKYDSRFGEWEEQVAVLAGEVQDIQDALSNLREKVDRTYNEVFIACVRETLSSEALKVIEKMVKDRMK